MIPSNRLLLRSKKTKVDKSPMETGIDPLKEFPLMLKPVRLGKEVKLRCSRVPERSALGRLISETVLPPLQTIPVQLQRLLRVVFHLRRASASVLAEAVVSTAKKHGSTRKMSAEA
nr:hypothetical protein DM860_012590 [Ipomoea trifida]